MTGKDAERMLEGVGITVNKNSIPNEPRSPQVTSGIRVGSAAAVTRGFSACELRRVGELIAEVLFAHDAPADHRRVRTEVEDLLTKHPLYPEL